MPLALSRTEAVFKKCYINNAGDFNRLAATSAPRGHRADPGRPAGARAAPAQHGLLNQMAVLTILMAGAARREAR